MMNMYDLCKNCTLSLLYNGKINSLHDLDINTNPKFFFDCILLFPNCMYNCILQIPVTFDKEEFTNNKNNIIQSLRNNFNKDNYEQATYG